MTWKGLAFILGITLVLFSCSRGPKTLLPRGLAKDSVLTEEQMVSLLTDIHILEARLQFQQNRSSKIGQEMISSYNGLFSKYKISERRFRLNLDYYRSDGDEFGKIYDRVIKEIDKKKNAIKP